MGYRWWYTVLWDIE